MTEAQARELGRLVKQARRSRGLSLRELDELTGVSYGWLSRLEGGLMTRASTEQTDARWPRRSALHRADRPDHPRTGLRATYRRSAPTFARSTTSAPRRSAQIEELFDQIRRNRREHPEGTAVMLARRVPDPSGPQRTRLVQRLRVLDPAWSIVRREARWIAERQAKAPARRCRHHHAAGARADRYRA